MIPSTKTRIGTSKDIPNPEPKDGWSIWIENGVWYTGETVPGDRGHAYDNGGYEIGIRGCPCGCRMGDTSSSGPYDPMGPCPWTEAPPAAQISYPPLRDLGRPQATVATNGFPPAPARADIPHKIVVEGKLKTIYSQPPVAIPLTPESTMAALREMDPYRRWRVCSWIMQNPGETEPVSASEIINYDGYKNSLTLNAWAFTWEAGTWEECLAQARAAFERDLDAQLRVLTEDHLESTDALWQAAKDAKDGPLRQRAIELHDNLMEDLQPGYNACGDKDNEVRED